MFGQVLACQVIAGGNRALRIDQIADASRQAELEILLAFDSGGIVGLADLLALVADQCVREVGPFGKGLLVSNGVKGRTDDCAVCGFKCWGSITEPSTLARSTRG